MLDASVVTLGAVCVPAEWTDSKMAARTCVTSSVSTSTFWKRALVFLCHWFAVFCSGSILWSFAMSRDVFVPVGRQRWWSKFSFLIQSLVYFVFIIDRNLSISQRYAFKLNNHSLQNDENT